MALWPRVFTRKHQNNSVALGLNVEQSYKRWMIRMLGHKRAYDLHERLEHERDLDAAAEHKRGRRARERRAKWRRGRGLDEDG